MTAGDVTPVPDSTGVHYLDTGMYDSPEYGTVYLLEAAEPAVIDTGIGADRERVFDALDAVGIGRDGLAHVVLTHVHLDHAGGAGYLAAENPDATVHVHERGARHLVDPGRLIAGTKAAVGEQWRHYAEPRPVPEGRVAPLPDEGAIDLGDRRLRARSAPGHAPHQVVLHDPGAEAVFVGDAAGLYVPERAIAYPTSPPPNFDLAAAVADTKTIAGLDPDRLLYTHFGPAPADGAGSDPATLLADYADRLRAWVADVERVHDDLGEEAAVIDHFVAESDLAAVWGETKTRYETALNVRGVLRSLDR
jgi:glyoxylase-like metal-dependent hydrolase (beta-lactamase superfamily II)